MEKNKLKIKYNVNILKWTATLFFLSGNLLFCAYKKEDMIQFMCFGIIINILAIFSFVMLSIFPRRYYIFDENGCSYQDHKGGEKNYISWDNIKSLFYSYSFGIFPEGLDFEFKQGYENRWIGLAISHRQVKMLCDAFPKVKELIGKRAL